jgi:hypothetical protein
MPGYNQKRPSYGVAVFVLSPAVPNFVSRRFAADTANVSVETRAR